MCTVLLINRPASQETRLRKDSTNRVFGLVCFSQRKNAPLYRKMTLSKIILSPCICELFSTEYDHVWTRGIHDCVLDQTHLGTVWKAAVSRVQQDGGGGGGGAPLVLSHGDRLVGPVGKASASKAEDPGFESRLRRDFFGVRSYQ